jgi:hypothetical protein
MARSVPVVLFFTEITWICLGGEASSASATFHPRPVSIITNVSFLVLFNLITNRIMFLSKFYHMTFVS